MPFTPFHFGPGAALYALAPRQFSFIAFCSVNILIDVESLFNLINKRAQVHAFFHTYIGATLVLIGTSTLFIILKWFASKYWLPNFFDWRGLSMKQVIVGAAVGVYSHVLLDSVMHSDIRPLAPVSSGNVLLSFISLGALHWLCIVSGLLGVVGVIVRKVIRHNQTTEQNQSV